MRARIGINGFGRTGRLALRIAYSRAEIEVVHVNEIKSGSPTAAHLMKFDSMHGQWPHQVRGDQAGLRINDDPPIASARPPRRAKSTGKEAASGS